MLGPPFITIDGVIQATSAYVLLVIVVQKELRKSVATANQIQVLRSRDPKTVIMIHHEFKTSLASEPKRVSLVTLDSSAMHS